MTEISVHMRGTRWKHATALIVSVIAGACLGSDEPTRQARLALLIAPRSEKGVALRAIARQDTSRAGAEEPVEIIYAIVNGPRPSTFDNHPGSYSFHLTAPDGRPAESLGGAGPALGYMGDFLVRLPTGSTLLQRQDLQCVSDGAYDEELPSSTDCLARYSLTMPGVYRLIVAYEGPDSWPNIDSARASAARGESRPGTYSPLTVGLRLADTVTFTVKAR
jgi:hypothetical protein